MLVPDQRMAQDDEDDVTTLDHSGADCSAWVHCTCRRPNKNITAERLLLKELFSKFQPFTFFQTKIVLLYCHTLVEDALRMFLTNMILLRPPARVKAAVKSLGWWGYETLGGW